MEITKSILTGSACYAAGKTITPKGIMVHSTATPGAMASRFITAWNKADATVCPHAVLDDTGVYQLLPWNHRGWHCGRSGNDTHIAFEICEPAGIVYNSSGSAIVSYDAAANAKYFTAVWNNAVALCFTLCREYHLTADSILCHSEGYAKGIASNHADVMHWFPKHNKTMDDFRADVAALISAQTVEKRYYKINTGYNDGRWSIAQKAAFEVVNGDAATALAKAIAYYVKEDLSGEYKVFDWEGNVAYQRKVTRWALEIPAQTYYYKTEAQAQAAADAINAVKAADGAGVKAVAEAKYK